MNFSGKNIHHHKQYDDNGDDLDGGFDGMWIKNIEHWKWCFVSGCKFCAAIITVIYVLGGK
jgi:hypothetical protein